MGGHRQDRAIKAGPSKNVGFPPKSSLGLRKQGEAPGLQGRFGLKSAGTSVAECGRMNIRFTSSLTPEDESRIAPVLIRAFAGILDLLPIAYAIRIDTSGADVFHHTGGASTNEWQPEPIVSRVSRGI